MTLKSNQKASQKVSLKIYRKILSKLRLWASILGSFLAHFSLKKRPWGTLGAPRCPQRGKMVPRRASRPPKSTKNYPQELKKHVFLRLSFLKKADSKDSKHSKAAKQNGVKGPAAPGFSSLYIYIYIYIYIANNSYNIMNP